MARLSVFVACPYLSIPQDDYRKVYETVSKAYPVDFRFADERITNNHILVKVSNYIRDNEFSLFDITGWNPNVALELGIAVGLGKKYFILFNPRMDGNKDAPSDIRGLDRIQYASNSELESKLMLLIKQELPAETEKSESAYARGKERILQSLIETPGLRLGEIADSINEDKAIVQSIIKSMMINSELKTRGIRRGTKYYTFDTDLRRVVRD
ncbi:hypothetical protein EYW49_15590 [Siculibacillus lacustris]|uniref:Uncharacterized protein n=1 Tax=Siculibacillus lacustris TaxID=1549641 RepID=A0A4Q9VM95_9HYPH|nr:hypothetical protein [Siculibacillus lacustris]TBW35815.1 hypothetical protein EYW49_15590 [Siculibacillus lacustris]